MKKLFIVLTVIILLSATPYLIYRFMFGWIPWTNLRVQTLPVEEAKIISGKFEHSVWPSNENIFPLFSPNKKYYATLSNSNRRKAEVLSLYKTDENKLIGTYSFREIAILGWEQDDSALYIEDFESGYGSLFLIFSRSGYNGPLKKIILPRD